MHNDKSAKLATWQKIATLPFLSLSIDYKKYEERSVFFFDLLTLRSLSNEGSVSSEQGSIFLEKQLSEQAKLSEQGGIIL